MRIIVLNGIRGWEMRRTKVRTLGKGLFRTSKESMAGRIKKRTIGNTTWYKNKRGGEQENKNANLREQRDAKKPTNKGRTTRGLKGN